MIDVSLPISLLSNELFASLYCLRKTESDPEVAVRLAFGKRDPDLVARVQGILARKAPDYDGFESALETSSLNTTKTLVDCDFFRIGEWVLGDYKSTKHLAHMAGISFRLTEQLQTGSFVYAFAFDEEVVYVGESAQQMGSRFQSYRYGNPLQTDTDNRVKIKITEALQQNKEVSIWYFSKSVDIDFGGERIPIPLSKPIDELMIRRLQPILNNTKHSRIE